MWTEAHGNAPPWRSVLESGILHAFQTPCALERSYVKYSVVLEESEEGFAVSVPGLPGCHSQGATEAEALENIADAIREYLEVVRELARSSGARQVEVEV